MDEIKEIVAKFKPISLEEMEAVSLMDRRDGKYLLQEGQLNSILEVLLDSYNILQIEGDRVFTYETLYYDSPDKNLYLWHHNKKLNRTKVRYRRYVENNQSFLEVKKKTNKDRTQKKRIPVNEIPSLAEEEIKLFIEKHFPDNSFELIPQLWVYFQRFTLVSHLMNERITVDRFLSYKLADRTIACQGVVVIENKRDGQLRNTPLLNILNELKIHESGMSKYCIGTALLNEDLKRNNFKSTIKKISKLQL